MLTSAVANYAASTSIASIPPDVRERAKRIIFDELACACFGRRSLGGDLTARYAATIGGAAEARILGTALRAPAPYAALANGAAGHGDEVDGTHVSGGHPGATIVHAAMATAERQRAAGADLITAVVLGYDIGTRIVNACGGVFVAEQRSRLRLDFLYALGATVAAGRLIGFEPSRYSHAMALVTFQVNCLCAMFQERRHISKSFSVGQYAFAGVSAALMADIGMEGADDILGAPYGLLDAWGAENGREIVTRDLGSDYAVMGANFKFANAGYPIHAALEAAITLVHEHQLDASRVSAVHIGMPANVLRVVDNRPMHNICVQDMVAAAIVQGGHSLSHPPFPAILDNPAFPVMRARITVGVDAELERDHPKGRGANVAITTTSGTRVEQRVEWPKGHSRRGGVTWEDLSAKWHDALPESDIDRALELARGLEDLDDASMLADAYGS